MQITAKDLKDHVDMHEGDRLLLNALQGSGEGEGALFTILARYIHFNSVFGGGVANLAGEIAVRKEMFIDPDEELRLIQDKSVVVAAAVFAAAVDEFGDRGTAGRFTHRALAQATFKSAAAFYGYTPEDVSMLGIDSPELRSAMEAVEIGYLLNQPVGEEEVFRGIGFHMSSEILADHEFRLLDSYLRVNAWGLLEYLATEPVEVGGEKLPGYRWIKIHTSVEADHFAFAVRAANLALRYYWDPRGLALAKHWILEGFMRFARVQQDFMAAIVK